MKEGVNPMKKRILALLLAAMILASAVSCGNGNEKETDKATDSDTTANSTETETEETKLTDSLPDDLDFGGATYTIYAREDLEWGTEMYVDELNGEIVNDAIYNRSRNVDDRLNVSIGQITAPGIWGNEASFQEAIRSAVMAGDDTYQLVAGYAYFITALATDGLFMNLLDVPYIDFEKPWWNSDLRDELTLYDQLYFACGDLSLTLLSSTFCMFFNKDMATKYSVPDLYETVQNGDWTYDNMYSLVQSIAVDLNGDGKMDAEDEYGLVMPIGNQCDLLFAAFDQPLTAKNADGSISIRMGDPKAQDIADKMMDLFTKNDGAFCVTEENNTEQTHYLPFREGRALLVTASFNFAEKTLRSLDLSYGIIPFPKYDENQEKYQTISQDAYSLFCVPLTAGDAEMIGAVTEALAFDSYENVTPAYFESAMKAKYSQDEASARMLDLIRDGLTFNFGFVNSSSCENMIHILRNVASSNKGYASIYAANEAKYTAALDTLVAKYKELGEKLKAAQ